MLLKTTYRSVGCQQHTGAFATFRDLFSRSRFDIIIELGSGSGAFTQFLADASGTTVLSWDIASPLTWPHRDSITYHSGDVLSGDVFETAAKAVAGSTRALILCDGGNKVAEFAMYASLVRSGDVIMAHDYARSREHFLNAIKGVVWDWCEITYPQIASAINSHGLVRHVMSDAFEEVVWGCFTKP